MPNSHAWKTGITKKMDLGFMTVPESKASHPPVLLSGQTAPGITRGDCAVCSPDEVLVIYGTVSFRMNNYGW